MRGEGPVHGNLSQMPTGDLLLEEDLVRTSCGQTLDVVLQIQRDSCIHDC